MQRIPFIEDDTNEPSELIESIKARRGGELLKLDRMLLHSPEFAAGWNVFLGKVRSNLTVPEKLAELAICYVAVLNQASYELEQHAPIFIAAGGSEKQVNALGNEPLESGLFDPVETAVLTLTREMTTKISVGDKTIAELSQLLGSVQKVVEIIGVVAAYNMVSRFLVALEITSEFD